MSSEIVLDQNSMIIREDVKDSEAEMYYEEPLSPVSFYSYKQELKALNSELNRFAEEGIPEDTSEIATMIENDDFNNEYPEFLFQSRTSNSMQLLPQSVEKKLDEV